MKIVHLSDLHISKKSRPQNIHRVRRLLEYAIEKNVDHFVVTGDLTHLGDKEDFVSLRNLFDEYNILDSEKLSLVIGNHDIFGGVHFAEDVLTYPRKCGLIDFKEKVREFKNYYFETFENAYFPLEECCLFFMKTIKDVLFVGLNSNNFYSKVKNPFASIGKVGKKQRVAFEKIFSDERFLNKRKVVLVHHHFNKKVLYHDEQKPTFFENIEAQAGRLKKKKKLLQLFKKFNIDLVLHGHLHESGGYLKRGIRFANAGGTIDKNKPGELKVNFIDVLNNAIQIKVEIIPEKARNIPQKERKDKAVYAL